MTNIFFARHQSYQLQHDVYRKHIDWKIKRTRYVLIEWVHVVHLTKERFPFASWNGAINIIRKSIYRKWLLAYRTVSTIQDTTYQLSIFTLSLVHRITVEGCGKERFNIGDQNLRVTFIDSLLRVWHVLSHVHLLLHHFDPFVHKQKVCVFANMQNFDFAKCVARARDHQTALTNVHESKSHPILWRYLVSFCSFFGHQF